MCVCVCVCVFPPQVILDLMPYEGVSVRRALSSDKLLMDRLGVTAVPATYLLHPNGTHGLMDAYVLSVRVCVCVCWCVVSM